MQQADAHQRVIKARDCRGLGSRVAFNFDDLRRSCDRQLELARQEAESIREAARSEAEQVGSEAFETARKKGFEQGLRNAEDEIQRRATEIAEQLANENLATTLPAMKELGETLIREREQWLAAWESQVMRMVVAVAEKVIRREITISPDVSHDIIRQTLQLVAGNSRIRIRLHPQDKERLGDFSSEMTASLSGIADAQLVADESVSAGGCLVETEHGTVDARIETQLQRIFDELTGSDGDSTCRPVNG